MTAGIYCIENLINGKKYIGYSVDINKRWRYHKSYLRRNKHENSFLQKSWNKHGESNFQFLILLECKKEELIDKEKECILIYNSRNPNFGYNLSEGGKGNLGWKASPETIIKHSLAARGEKNPMFGKNHSNKTRDLFSSQRIGNKNGVGNKNNLGNIAKRKGSSSQYFGVFIIYRTNKNGEKYIRWQTRFSYDSKETKLGTHINEIDAAKTFDKKSWETFHDFSKLNFTKDYK